MTLKTFKILNEGKMFEYDGELIDLNEEEIDNYIGIQLGKVDFEKQLSELKRVMNPCWLKTRLEILNSLR